MSSEMTTANPPDVTIIIPTKNGQAYLAEVLDGIYAQVTGYRFEVLVIDSGSTDATLAILGRYPVGLHAIPPEQFNHGATRDLGGELAHPASRFLVYLTQDATPLPGWLDHVLQPLEADPQVAGAFSRHVPRPDCNPILARSMTQDWEQCGTMARVVKRVTDVGDFSRRRMHYVYFANTSSCLRRSVWEQYHFLAAEFGEDAQWAERVLTAGYTLVYEPGSTVLHSHSYPLLQHCRQNFDHARGMHRFAAPAEAGQPARKAGLVLSSLGTVRRDWAYIWRSSHFSLRQKLYWSGYSPLWHGAAGLGTWLGAASPAISEAMQPWFSRQSRLRLRGQ